MRSILFAVTLLVVASVAAPALAQPAGEPTGDPAAAPARSPAAAAPAESALARQCKEAIDTDPRLRAQVKNQVRLDVHTEDAQLMLRNKRHVVISYAVLWALAVVFLVLLYLRQRRLLGEIARLEAEVKRAAEEE
jgi:hypothetical protein